MITLTPGSSTKFSRQCPPPRTTTSGRGAPGRDRRCGRQAGDGESRISPSSSPILIAHGKVLPFAHERKFRNRDNPGFPGREVHKGGMFGIPENDASPRFSANQAIMTA
jgi:hypothetical protein